MMKKLNIVLTIGLMAVIYSCGNGEEESNEQNADSLATAEQIQAAEEVSMTEEEKTELYKYFSKEEMKSEMDKAKNILCGIDKETGSTNVVSYDDLLKEEGFSVSPTQLEKKWGEAQNKEIKTDRLDYGDGLVYDKKSATMEFPFFDVILVGCGKDCWTIETLKTETKGFGFGGVYVGVPECNKTYLLQLFKNFEVQESQNDGNTMLDVTLHSEFYRGLYILLDQNNLVKSVKYEVSTTAGL